MYYRAIDEREAADLVADENKQIASAFDRKPVSCWTRLICEESNQTNSADIDYLN